MKRKSAPLSSLGIVLIMVAIGSTAIAGAGEPAEFSNNEEMFWPDLSKISFSDYYFINTGERTQSKLGGLNIAVRIGNLGIGIADPQEKVTLNGGSLSINGELGGLGFYKDSWGGQGSFAEAFSYPEGQEGLLINAFRYTSPVTIRTFSAAGEPKDIIIHEGEVLGKVNGIPPIMALTDVAVQSAIDALPDNGGIIVLPPGTYDIRNCIYLPNNVTIRGAGMSTILQANQLEENENVIASSDPGSGNNGINVSNLVVIGMGTQHGGTGILFYVNGSCAIENVRVSLCGTGIKVTGIDSNPVLDIYASITNSQVCYVGQKGFAIRYLNYAQLNGCSAQSCAEQGFWGSSGNFVTLNNCMANSCGQDGFLPSYSSHHWTFTGCIARGNGYCGFTMNSAGEEHDFTLSSCIAENNGRYGFQTRASHVVFNGCKADSNNYGGLSICALGHDIDSVSVSGGEFNNNNWNDGVGIAITPGSNAIKWLSINGTICTSNKFGIQCEGGNLSYGILSGNVCRNNRLSGIETCGGTLNVDPSNIQ